MRLGVISDVHGNLSALEAVLDDMPEEVDEVLCLGDVVGYNPYPSECVDLVQESCSYVLQGNHDREIRNPGVYSGNRQAEQGLEYARNELGDDQVEYLLERPEQIEVEGFLAVHSHPENLDEYVFSSDFESLEKYLDGFQGVLLGHTHIQHKSYLGEGMVLNPGSVGQPRDGCAARYAVVDTEAVEAELYSTMYDVGSTVEGIRDAGLPSASAERLLPDEGQRGGRSGSRGNPWR